MWSLPLTTARLRLRRFDAGDATTLATYRSDPAVAKYQGWEAPYAVEAAARLIDEQRDLDGPVAGRWIQIAVDHEGRLAGDVAVGIDDGGHVATIGYTLAVEHQGQGFATEAVGAVIDALLEAGIGRVQASVDPRNTPSAQVVERLGFEYEGTARRSAFVHGEWVDDDHYALTPDLAAAWRQRPVGRPRDVRLVPVTPDNAVAVRRLRTHHSQERFVATVEDSFADALVPEVVDGAPVVPWLRAIEADGELVGFLMTAERSDVHPETYLWRLLVDRRHQRRGVGDRALALLVDRLRADGHSTLGVGWVPAPGGPGPFYLARGFVPTGEIDEGEIQARLRLDQQAAEPSLGPR
jgi:RimJ/RimL family protein N-acetyltransferase